MPPSNIIVPRFENDSCPRKRRISRMFGDLAFFSTAPHLRNYGADTVSATGTNLLAHYGDNEPWLGSKKSLLVAENDYRVLKLIIAEHAKNLRYKRYPAEKVVIPQSPIDIWKLSRQTFGSHNRAYRGFIDADLCKSFKVLVREGLLDEMWETRQCVSKWILDNGLWLVLTWGGRDNAHTQEEIVRQVIQA